MKKYPTNEPRTLKLFLKDIFPLCDLAPTGKDNDQLVNKAYEQLFEQLIPGFHEGDVHFVLAEVLELDREKSRPRILVYSNKDKKGVDTLLKKYFKVIASLREDEWSISKSDAFYTGSRIWCAEMASPGRRVAREGRGWLYEPMDEMSRGYEFDEESDEEKEMEEINVAFDKYIRALYDLHLKNYPYSYVMLIPIFLGSMYGEKKKSRKKLGAIFLHFATGKRVDEEQVLRRIYGRTLLFWHYYFTSEALDKRQELFERSERANEALERSQALFNKIKPYINDIRQSMRKVQEPLLKLEAALNPPEVIIFGGDLSKYFHAGQPIPILGGRHQVTPRHGWKDDVGVEAYKDLIAGLLIERFRLDDDLAANGEDLWAQVSKVIESRAGEPSNRLFGELAHSIPGLCVGKPTEKQVKETFKIIKSWFSDARKVEGGTGMPVSMLEFAFRVWSCEFLKGDLDTKSFWVASEPPAATISALGILHDERPFQEAKLDVKKIRGGTGKAVTCCEMRLALGGSARKGARLERLRSSLDKSVKKGATPGGNMTRFLWDLCGGRRLALDGTAFCWRDGDQEVEINFFDARGLAQEMLIRWKGAISV